MAALLALLSALGWGGSDYAAGIASRRSHAVSVVILTHFVAVLVLLVFVVDLPLPTLTHVTVDGDRWALAFSFGRPGWRGVVTARDLLWGAGSGISGGMGAMLLYRGLARGAMAVVAPITAAGAAMVPAVWGLVEGEPLTALGAAALGLAMVAIVLVSWSADAAPVAEPGTPVPSGPETTEDRLARVESELAELRSWVLSGRRAGQGAGRGRALLGRPGVPEALLSGLGFGGFYVLLDGTSADAGLWPLVAARGASVLMFVSLALMTRVAVAPGRGSRVPVLWAGVLDAAAAVSFLYATRSGYLSIAAVLSSLYPGVTVLLARMLTKERLVHRQLAGLGCAGVAIALFAVA